MAVDPKVKQAIAKKLHITDRHVDRLITAEATRLMLGRDQAAIAVAIENGVNVTRLATNDDLLAIRHAKAGTAPYSAPAQAATSREPTRRRSPRGPAKKSGTPKKVVVKKRVGDPKKVFVVYGRDDTRKRSMFSFLRAIGLTPLDFRSAIRPTGKAAPYVGEVLEAAFKEAAAVVVLLTPDDEARLLLQFQKKGDPAYEKKLTGQARPNVLFEAGLAFGYHPDKTLLVQIGQMRPFSDVGGRHVIHLNNSPEARSDVVTRLQVAGCDVDATSNVDWFTEGDFSS